MQIDINATERTIIQLALKSIKPLIQEPKTGFHIRQSYKGLLEKLKRDESLSDEIRKTM